MAFSKQYHEIIGAMHRLELLRRISIRDNARGIEIRRAQMPMLEYIAAHEGCTQADISKYLHVSPASVACSAKRMEAAGLIARAADESNLRCNRLSATAEGLARLAQMRAVVVAHNGHQAVAQAEHRHKDEGLQLKVRAQHVDGHVAKAQQDHVHQHIHDRRDGLHHNAGDAHGQDVRQHRAVRAEEGAQGEMQLIDTVDCGCI